MWIYVNMSWKVAHLCSWAQKVLIYSDSSSISFRLRPIIINQHKTPKFLLACYIPAVYPMHICHCRQLYGLTCHRLDIVEIEGTCIRYYKCINIYVINLFNNNDTIYSRGRLTNTSCWVDTLAWYYGWIQKCISYSNTSTWIMQK